MKTPPSAAGPAADEIQGGEGNDTVFAGQYTIYGEGGNDLIDAGADNDFALGGAGADKIRGGAGNDGIDGGAGNDYAEGNEGNDVIYGDLGLFPAQGAGDDTLLGNAGDDVLYGGYGNDNLLGGEGLDIVFGERRRLPVCLVWPRPSRRRRGCRPVRLRYYECDEPPSACWGFKEAVVVDQDRLVFHTSLEGHLSATISGSNVLIFADQDHNGVAVPVCGYGRRRRADARRVARLHAWRGDAGRTVGDRAEKSGRANCRRTRDRRLLGMCD